jgi:ABC-type nitrate/sulfonate/bicarbonate transport system substrate-binding protein
MCLVGQFPSLKATVELRFCQPNLEQLSSNANHTVELYLTPLHLALRSPAISSLPFKIDLTPFPSGTGHMITSLRGNEIDLAIGLTEGWVAGLAGKQQSSQNSGDGGYKVVGHWVDNPLRWAIVTGRNRDEVNGVSDLKGSRVGVSRLGR